MHKFQDSILHTRLAFTVSHWDLISRVNFLWIFGMHVLMVLGWYMPNPILEGHFHLQVSKLNDGSFYCVAFMVVKRLGECSQGECSQWHRAS